MAAEGQGTERDMDGTASDLASPRPTRVQSKWKLLILGVPILILAEQWTKFLAVERLTAVFAGAADLSLYEKLRVFYGYRHLEPLAREPYAVWRGFWRMTYAENPGSAFGLFGTMPPALRFAFFTMITVAAVAFIIGAYRRLRENQRVRQIALVLVLAGAVGNFTDRLARRYVIDFIDWGVRDLRWPTFNLADVFIVVGVALLLLTDSRPLRVVAGDTKSDGGERRGVP
jgi:signal peptidase II